MECWTLLHGGYNYSLPESKDAMHHDTIEEAEAHFWRWVDEPRNMADDSTEMFVFLGAPPNDIDFLPDFRIYQGPRGGIRRERA